MPQLDFETTNLWFAISCAIDVLVVCGAVWTRRPLIVLAALGALALKGLVLIAAGLEVPFGVQHVVWLDVAIVLPLAGAVAFVRMRRAVFLLALAAAPLAAYASFVEPERLVTERATVKVAPARAGGDALRVGVLADIQFERVGDHERDAVERLMRLEPDLILLPGDFHQGTDASFERERPAIRALLRRLRAPGGVFAVQGDSESLPKLQRALEGTRIEPLVNARHETGIRGWRIELAGVERDFETPAARAVVERMERPAGRPDVRILLAHRPDVALGLRRDSRIDLVVAGHTHGGQVQLPLLGPPFTASSISRDIAAGGLHELRGNAIYVSRGVGVERNQAPKLRFGAPPEISLLTLR